MVTNDPPNHSRATERMTGTAHFVVLFMIYGLLLRVFNYFDLLAVDAVETSVLGPPFSLLFIMGEDLLLALLLGAVLFLSWPVRPARLAWMVLLSVYMIWLAVLQGAFGTFFHHIDYIIFLELRDPTAITNLSSSITDSFDIPFWVCIAAALVASVLLLVPRRPAMVRRLAKSITSHPLRFATGAALYVALTYGLSMAADQHQLQRSFPVTYISSYLGALQEEEDIDRLGKTTPQVAHKTVKTGTLSLPDAGPPSGSDPSAKRRKLNVVWYLMESTSYRETSMFPDAPYDTTPFIKELASKSLFFDNYYTIVAASTRSFFSAITGVYPYMDRSSNLARYSQVQLPTLPDILHEEGYNTAFFANSDSMFEGLDTYVSRRSYDHYMDKNLVPREELPPDTQVYWGFDEEVMIDRALQWIDDVKDTGKPFYLSYNAVYPHHPFKVPEQHADLLKMEWGEPRTRRMFRASLAYADRSVKRMYEGLVKLGIEGDTLFIVTPDHGETFGDLHKKNFIHAEYCFEEDQRIFLLMHNPDTLGEPRVVHNLGSHLDLLPTLLDVLGIERELAIDGRSLMDFDREEQVLYHFSRRQLALRDGDYKFMMNRNRGEGRPTLYNLRKDPTEQDSLAPENRDLVSKYRSMSLGWQASVAGEFKRRCEEAGMTSSEMADAAEQKRKEMFSKTQMKLGPFTVCPGAGNTSCSGKPKNFAVGTTLTVRANLARHGDARIKVEVFHRKGDRVWAKIKDAEARKTATFVVPTGDLKSGERYRMRISSVYYRAIHDTRWYPFDMK